ncbi:MAG: prepilin-type N-terminal cleavage/methylation domain-containing protein [Planctomycetes bacterium]|nr:prepilin-type N-terminal cleavage/methylation domain-containing protein [Planctomycetota bacterium]
MRIPNLVRRTATAGFTLIELLAVILILGILMTFLIPRVTEAVDAANVTACRKNMQEIYGALLQYQIHNKTKDSIPTQSGVKFFGALIADGVWENTEANGKRLTCPGVSISQLQLGEIDDAQEWFMHLDAIDGNYSAYAGRDQNASGAGKGAKSKGGELCGRIGKLPASGKQILVADDNASKPGEGNHRGSTVVLYADGTASSFELMELHKNGTLTEDEKVLTVGPDSPVEPLRCLSLD